nr:MAG TPA: hypothetical protein [Caudoviricetes sp.]
MQQFDKNDYSIVFTSLFIGLQLIIQREFIINC